MATSGLVVELEFELLGSESNRATFGCCNIFRYQTMNSNCIAASAMILLIRIQKNELSIAGCLVM